MKPRSHLSLRPAALALCAAFALAAPAFARPPADRPVGGLIARNAERLGLEGDALLAVQAVVQASGVRHEELLQKLESAQAAMRELLSQPVPDSDAVMAQADALGALETELHKNRLKAILDIRALLTPAQREELLKIREEERAQRGEHGDCERHAGEDPEKTPPR
jgi:Spy/CpxP family protein refolding chaperone